MKSQALIMMVATNLIVAGFTIYFFWKVLATPTRLDEPDDEDLNYPRGG